MRDKWKGFRRSGCGLTEVLTWNFPGGTEENHGRLRKAGIPAYTQSKHLINISLE
jgi:hypothetical protein